MKIISLNTWGGRAGKEKLLSFFDNYKGEIDIFCLQEIWSSPYEHLEGTPAGGRSIEHSEIMVYGMQEISSLLSGYKAYFHPQHLDNYGLMLLVRKNLSILNEGEVFVYRHKGYVPEGDVGNHARNIQYVAIETKNGPITVMNFHGLWNGKGKGDSEDRLVQSDRIVSFLSKISTPVIFCGDFNLNPDTESLKKIGESGLRNLISEYGITSTRTKLYTKPGKYADYIFASDQVGVKDFKILPVEVSDHAPLYLEVE